MAKLRRPEPTRDDGPAVSDDMPAHEGPMPNPSDTENYTRWRRIRSARMLRDMGGPNDVRNLLDPDGARRR